ncbi:CaiB/BaiF CoA transferase family protein [Streptomyces canus]|uniref:CaiB/BaiF CoA transferase family protein n=1 Tax=Streptomyces canus TaxID=58343 RepID=UPI00367450B6
MTTSSSKPLDGITVLDFTQLIAGPSAGVMLMDLGATVTKIERPGGELGRSISAVGGLVPTLVAYNRGKRSMALNTATEEGREIVARLIDSVDVVLEGFRPGAMDRLGLGAEASLARNPELIYASISAYPPGLDRPGVDAVMQAAAGITDITGTAEGGPVKVGFQVVDAATGFVVVQAVLAALLNRHRTGQGSRLNVSLFEVATFMQSPGYLGASLSGQAQQRQGNTAGQMGYPTDMFTTSDGGLIQIAAYFSSQWTLLCEVLGMPDLATEERFIDNASRTRNQSQLHEILQRIFATRTRGEWEKLLTEAGVIASAVRNQVEILTNDDLPPDTFAPIDLQSAGEGLLPRSPFRTTSWDVTPTGRCPEPSEQSTEILGELGYDQNAIAALFTKGIVDEPPHDRAAHAGALGVPNRTHLDNQ